MDRIDQIEIIQNLYTKQKEKDKIEIGKIKEKL